ncbi:carbohydrate kinase [Candidatus Aerophobetes bacterium]|uniref:Carbohydrate kinase n=1 Tax=Aerophobetes bacterium TaxID=2030807 RepID=A0A662D0Y9_UNCAE|nr:MAG: carbohydrate kinase [Candidatus Aerophobetes bacterium]
MTSYEFDVVLVGDFAKDEDIVDGRRRNLLGGAVYYGAFPLKLIGINVAVVTKLARKDFPELSVFKRAGIPVFVREAPQTTGIKNVYFTEDPDRRQSYPLGFAGSFSERDFPNVHAKIIHIGALIKGEIPLRMIEKLSQKADLSLDVQGFVRVEEGDQLILRDWSEKRIALPYIKYLKADAVEAKVLTGTSDLPTAAKSLANMGPSEVLITHKRGVVLFAKGRFYQAPFRPKSLRGRSGRGDTCISTYIAKRLTSPPYKALCFAAALTTLKLEKEGPFRGKPKDVEILSRKFEMSSS